MPDRVERIEIEPGAIDAVLAIIDGRRHAVLTVNGRDTAVISTPDSTYEIGFALAVEALTVGLDQAIESICPSSGR